VWDTPQRAAELSATQIVRRPRRRMPSWASPPTDSGRFRAADFYLPTADALKLRHIAAIETVDLIEQATCSGQPPQLPIQSAAIRRRLVRELTVAGAIRTRLRRW